MNMKLTLDTPVKFLCDNLAAPIGAGSWIVGDWMVPIDGDLVPCQNGYHYTTIEHWQQHLSDRMFLITPGDEVIADDTKWVCRTAKLTAEVTNWNQRNLSLFAADCAERVAHHNSDPRVMATIVAVRDFWAGKISMEELRAAAYAADHAAHAAAYATARAAYAAARAADAAYAAARAAANAAYAAYAAVGVYAAAYDARAAAAYAAYAADAAVGAADAAAAYAAAARAAEREWQNDRLLQYLNGEV